MGLQFKIYLCKCQSLHPMVDALHFCICSTLIVVVLHVMVLFLSLSICFWGEEMKRKRLIVFVGETMT